MSSDRVPAPLNDNVFRAFLRQLRLGWHLFLDPRVNWMAKALPIISAIYVISPVDLIPAIPVLSSMDDLAVAFLGLKLFIEFSPPEVVQEHLRRLQQAVGNWEVVNDATKTETGVQRVPEEVIEGDYTVTDDEPAN
jgi:uncharacterized membrane protein YkvA (DUF1232 family)